MHVHGATPYTFRRFTEVPPDSPFKLQDTLTSRAEIADLSEKFRDEVVAQIGLGGSGAYLLDYLVKTPVKEIRAFDLDDFHVHNAFRSPGSLALKELGQKKASVYAGRYENFRHGLRVMSKSIDETSHAELEGVTFAFVCVDKGSSRSANLDLLISKSIPFIDVGMGLQRAADASLKGMMRLTYYPPQDAERIRAMNLAEMIDPPEGIYRTNVQIAELNAMNASLAMIRYKQLRGFYSTEEAYYHLLFDLTDLKMVGSQL